MLHRRWLAGCSCMARAYEPVKMHYMYYQRSLQLVSFHISPFRVFTSNPISPPSPRAFETPDFATKELCSKLLEAFSGACHGTCTVWKELM